MEKDPAQNDGSSEATDATAGDFSRPLGSLISWEIKDDEVVRGTIQGHPETTMFLLNAQYDGSIKLMGCFIPDDEEREEVYDLETAKMAAEGYLLGWLRTVGVEILSANDQVEARRK